ncbi:type II toxin-antitoxin system RelB/DinJ family antitoxin [Weissella bombi]|uniref:DNA-damage-inducible protein J n=1 Tax=Weissella bombi TaxID=1505725 RepID=A0A1C4AV58_9LACO|nr:type II toxin-antitoxin system RelB/DinJ family antitoxin [Weissella bombi]SCB98479.1 DNA-damage-inducible protein J [Weissella bombi]
MEKLIQIRVEEDVRNAADDVFKENGLTTQQAVKMFLTQVAHSGKSPFDDLFRAKNQK